MSAECFYDPEGNVASLVNPCTALQQTMHLRDFEVFPLCHSLRKTHHDKRSKKLDNKITLYIII